MTNLDDLKNMWQSQSGVSKERFDQIGEKVQASTTLFQKTIFRRDMLETCASVFVVAFFAPGLWTAKNWIAWSGFAIIVLAGITIPFVLWWGRRRSIKAVSAANFCDFLDIEIDFLRRQVQLLRMVTWWYLMPIYIGVVLITVGPTEPTRGSLFEPIFLTVYLTFCTAVFVYIWWFNQHARKKHLEPLLSYYVEMRNTVESGEDVELQVGDPPTAFLERRPRKPLSRRQKAIWIVLIVVVTAFVAGIGYAAMHQFDERTGLFLLSTSPVVAILMIVVSGVWRRGAE